MNRVAARWPGPAMSSTRVSRVLRTSPALAAVALACVALCAPAVAQDKAKNVAGAISGSGAAAKAATSQRTSTKPLAAKGPVAAKNVAVAAAAVPTAPTAVLAHGCLDTPHGEWLSSELGEAAAALRDLAAVEPFEAAPTSGTRGCVPFASVRSRANRIESLALLPPPGLGESGEARRLMVVSRQDLGRAATTTWHDLAEGPTGQRETWVRASALLSGEAAEKLPPRWLREASLLVRQMRRQSVGDDLGWVRLVFRDGGNGGDSSRLVALELVDETGQPIDSALWLERGETPGGFVSARGGDHERVSWQSPVDYRRISRGVGASTVIVRKRVVAQPKTPGGKPRVVIRSFRTRGQHQGIDFAAPMGTPVVTVADGTVVHAGKSGGYGNLVVVDHGGGINTYYAHLSAFGAGIDEGAKVERGQEIGLVGSTGMSTGPHLHYEIRKDGRYLDPADPAQTLPNWGLAAEEHEAVLTRLMALSLSRAQAFARAARVLLSTAAVGTATATVTATAASSAAAE